MNTVYINGRCLTQRASGVQRYALETLFALDAMYARGEGDAEIELCVLAPPGTPAPKLRSLRFRTVGPLQGNAWEQLTLAWATRGAFLLSFSATGPLLKRAQIVTMHDAAVHMIPGAFTFSFRSWYKLLLPTLARRTPYVMTVSEFSKRQLIQFFGAREQDTRVTGEGWQHVERLAADPSVLAEHGLTKGGYALTVSNVTPHKNFAVIARAAQRQAEHPIPIVAVGALKVDGVFEQVDLSALGSLKLLGFVDDQKLRALYENAAVFVFPSLFEGFGIPPLEAMALGCPVIASDAAAIPETCGDAAWYFSPHDDERLAALLQRATSDDTARAELVARGRARLASFSWESCARRHLDVLQQVFAARA